MKVKRITSSTENKKDCNTSGAIVYQQDNMDEMDKFLETQNLSKLNHEEKFEYINNQ